MSAPPTNSPLMKSWGIVGQLEIAESSWRIRGSGRMSTAANGTPVASRAAAETNGLNEGPGGRSEALEAERLWLDCHWLESGR